MSDKTEVTEIPLNKIKAAPWQPRELFDKDKIKSLGESLKEKGIIQPIVVRKDKTGEGYELIAGERRFRAWSYTGKATIPAVIKDVDDFTAKEISIIENWHREDLTENEKDKFILELWRDGQHTKYNASVTEMGRTVGISPQIISEIIKSDQERNSLKNEKRLTPDILEQTTYTDLAITRALDKNPEARAELLNMRVSSPDLLKKTEARIVSISVSEAPLEKQVRIAKLISSVQLKRSCTYSI